MSFKKCPSCYGMLEDDGSCSCGYGVQKRGDRKSAALEVDRRCTWNERGARCNLDSCMSESTNGSGPWYCSDHYWYGLKGWKRPNPDAPKPMNYRERWYHERALAYEPPKVTSSISMEHWRKLYGPDSKRMREPGED